MTRQVVKDFINYKSAVASVRNFMEESTEVITDRMKDIFKETINNIGQSYDYFGNTFSTEVEELNPYLHVGHVRVAMPLEGTRYFMKLYYIYNLSEELVNGKHKWIVSVFTYKQSNITDRTTFTNNLRYGIDLELVKYVPFDAFVADNYKM